MRDSIKVGLDRKQKTEEKFSSRTQKLLDIAKNTRLEADFSAIDFHAYEPVKKLEEYKARADQNKAEAIIFLRRQLITQ